MKTEPPAGAAGSPITLSVDAIIQTGGFEGSRLFRAGEAIPFDAETVPDSLRPYIASEEETEPPGPPGIRFQQGITYRTDAEGHILTKAGARAAAQLAGEAFVQQQAEEEAIAAGTLDPETEAALADAHDRRIGIALLTARIAAEQRDRAPELIAAAQAEEAAAGESGILAEVKPEPERELFVRRGSAWWRAARTKLRAGESLFTKQPDGEWVAVDQVPAKEETK